MNFKTISLFSLLSLFLLGCANQGSVVLKKLSESDVNKQIIVGKTTRNQVRAAFGSPLETTYTDGGLEIWKYRFEVTTGWNAANIASQTLTLGLAGSRQVGVEKELIILYNDDYTVKRFNMSASPVQRGTGLL
jgi:outer membrane protein assembly factor BamE (lipoprotein component of BamABCDE complex)